MDVDVVSCVYHCFHCPEEMQKHTGALDLYSRVRLGAPSYQMNPKKVYHWLCKELEGKSTCIRNMKQTVPKDNNIYPTEDECDAICLGLAGIYEEKKNKSAF
jgi:CRISPR/Cas system-associated protein endoribonuclease Cas2